MRVFEVNEKVVVETTDGGKFEGIVSLSSEKNIKLRKVLCDGKDFYNELTFFSYEVMSIFLPEEKSKGGRKERQDRVVEGSSSGDEIDLFQSAALNKIDASDGLVTNVATEDKVDVKSHSQESEACVNKRGKAPVAVLKTVPPHLQVFPFHERNREKLMLTAVAREEMGEEVELEMKLLSEGNLRSFVEELPGETVENASPSCFVFLTDLSSDDAIICFRHINSCSTIGISWEGVQSEDTKQSSSVSLLCLSTSYLVCCLDVVAIANASGGTLPEFFCEFLRNRQEDRTFVAFDVRPLAHALMSNWSIELSSQTVDLQLFELSLSALNTPTGRRSDGTSLMQSTSLYKLVLEELKVEREPLYVRGKYRQNDMTLWMKRPLSNVLLNAALFHAGYLVPLFYRLRQRMLKPIMAKSQKRWKLAISNNCVSSWDLNLSSFVSLSNPLSFWRLSSPTDSTQVKERERKSFQEKKNQPKSARDERSRVKQRRSCPNPSTSPPAVNRSDSNLGAPTSYARNPSLEVDSLNDNLESTLKIGADSDLKNVENSKVTSVPCSSVLFDRSQFFDMDIPVDSYTPGPEKCDDDYGTIPSKPRRYTETLSSFMSERKKEETTGDLSYVSVNNLLTCHSNEEPFPSVHNPRVRSESPPLTERPSRPFGRGQGRGLNILASKLRKEYS